MPNSALSVAQLAERWSVPPGKILALIRSGELPAVNLALRTGPGCRPRWRISLAEIEAFERRRSGGPPPKPSRRRTAEKPAGWREYF